MRGAHWLWVTIFRSPNPGPPHSAADHDRQPVRHAEDDASGQGGDPNQQKMMMFMPLIFGFMFYNLSSGLVLYYLTSNLVGIGQQWFFNHTERR